MSTAFETFLLTPDTQRGDICIGARSIYVLQNGTASLAIPERAKVSLSAGQTVWIPAGVTHRVMIEEGQAYALRLRKGAFSVDQETDVQARQLMVRLDTYARGKQHDFILPPHGSKAPKELPSIAECIQAIIRQPKDPFVAKASALTILRHFIGIIPTLSAEEELPPAPSRIQAFIGWLKEHHAEPITMADALRQTHLSKSHFHRCFHDATGTSLSRYLNRERISVAKNLLLHSQRSILDIALHCGFDSVSRFYEVFSENVRCSPKEYQRQQAPSD